MTKAPIRCVNLDWLEVYCLEPIDSPRDADYYRGRGLWVREREYGTRIYEEMITILSDREEPLWEVRRNPKQKGGSFSVLPINACHVRLRNRSCYFDNAAAYLRSILVEHGLQFVSINRVDICLDFEKFDFGDDPQRFLYRYMKNRYTKINQSNVAAHGRDHWDGRAWNSLSWGSPKSPVSTKFYNKTLELKEVHDKPWIRQAWWECGLVTDYVKGTKLDASGVEYTPTIWRLEFSIKSSVKNWLTYEADGKPKKYRSVRNTLDMYDTRKKILIMFATLCQHYFHFKTYRPNVSKYDCPDKPLFDFSGEQVFYKVEHPAATRANSNVVQRFKKQLEVFNAMFGSADVHDAIISLQRYVDRLLQSTIAENPEDIRYVHALQYALKQKIEGSLKAPSELIEEYLQFEANQLIL